VRAPARVTLSVRADENVSHRRAYRSKLRWQRRRKGRRLDASALPGARRSPRRRGEKVSASWTVPQDGQVQGQRRHQRGEQLLLRLKRKGGGSLEAESKSTELYEEPRKPPSGQAYDAAKLVLRPRS
jgi:hypothetical protein